MFERFSRDSSDMTIQQLFRKVANDMTLLVRKEVELAKSESKEELQKELRVMIGLGACGAVAFLGLAIAATALLVHFLGWGGAAIVGFAMLLIAGGIGALLWAKRVKRPLPATQQMLKEDAQWLKATIIKRP